MNTLMQSNIRDMAAISQKGQWENTANVVLKLRKGMISKNYSFSTYLSAQMSLTSNKVKDKVITFFIASAMYFCCYGKEMAYQGLYFGALNVWAEQRDVTLVNSADAGFWYKQDPTILINRYKAKHAKGDYKIDFKDFVKVVQNYSYRYAVKLMSLPKDDFQRFFEEGYQDQNIKSIKLNLENLQSSQIEAQEVAEDVGTVCQIAGAVVGAFYNVACSLVNVAVKMVQDVSNQKDTSEELFLKRLLNLHAELKVNPKQVVKGIYSSVLINAKASMKEFISEKEVSKEDFKKHIKGIRGDLDTYWNRSGLNGLGGKLSSFAAKMFVRANVLNEKLVDELYKELEEEQGRRFHSTSSYVDGTMIADHLFTSLWKEADGRSVVKGIGKEFVEKRVQRGVDKMQQKNSGLTGRIGTRLVGNAVVAGASAYYNRVTS